MPEEGLLKSTLYLFDSLKRGSIKDFLDEVSYPFNLDGLELRNEEALREALEGRFAAADLSGLRFYGVQTLPAATALERYGPAPKRLAAVDLSEAWVSVANFGGHGYVAVFVKKGRRWRAVAYSD